MIKGTEKNQEFFYPSLFPKSRRGWVRVIEAFIAILLIGTVILLLTGQNSSSEDISSLIYQDQLSMLRTVQLNDTLRSSVIQANTIPTMTDEESFPADVEAALNSKNPGYLNCKAKICALNAECLIENNADIDIYTANVAIFADIEDYNPRRLVLSCVLIEG
ncbi:MAG: hypothetical protein WD876_03355, partial [Candidatus Pacearchaeota archaeon]